MLKLTLSSSQRKILIFIVGAIFLFGALTFTNCLAEHHGYTESWSTSSTSDNPLHVGESISKSANSGHSHSISHSTSAIKIF